MSKRKQSSLLGNFRFTFKKLNRDSGGGSAANNVNAGPSSANASTCLVSLPPSSPGETADTSESGCWSVKQLQEWKECYPWLEINVGKLGCLKKLSEKGPGVHLAVKWINGDGSASDSNKL